MENKVHRITTFGISIALMFLMLMPCGVFATQISQNQNSDISVIKGSGPIPAKYPVQTTESGTYNKIRINPMLNGFWDDPLQWIKDNAFTTLSDEELEELNKPELEKAQEALEANETDYKLYIEDMERNQRENPNLIGILMSVMSDWFLNVFDSFYAGNTGIVVLHQSNEIYQKTYKDLLEKDGIAAMFEMIRAIGTALVIIYFTIDINSRILDKNFTPVSMLQSGFGFVISITLIAVVPLIINYLVGIGGEVAVALTSNKGEAEFVYFTAEERKLFREGVKVLGDTSFLSYITKVAIAGLIAQIDYVVIVYVAFTRIITLSARAFFAPIAVANFYSEGARSSAVRFFRKTGALCLQYAVVIAISYASTMLMQMTTTTVSVNGESVGNAKLLHDLLVNHNFNGQSCFIFLEVMLGGSMDFLQRCAIVLTKVGITIKSLQLCEEIVG